MSNSDQTGKITLTKYFVYYALSIVVLLFLITAWVSYMIYSEYTTEREYFLTKESQKLQLVFDQKLRFLEGILQFIANKIHNNTNHSLEEIAETIKHHKSNFKGEAFAWNIINFVDDKGNLVADSINGLRIPTRFDVDKRYWLKKAKTDPWILHFSKPDLGVISKELILPTGLGIYDSTRNKFIGFISASPSIERLTSSLSSVIDEDLRFVLFDFDLYFIASSSKAISGAHTEFFADTLKKIRSSNTHRKVQKLTSYIEVEGVIFSHCFPSETYPFIFCVGEDKQQYHSEITNIIVPKVSWYILCGIVFTMVIIYLGYQIVRPVVELSKTADKISKGRSPEIHNYYVKEFNNLSSQLGSISEMAKNLRHKQWQLSKSNIELEGANEFIKNNMSFLSHELINPVATTLGFAKILKDKFKRYKDQELQEYTDIIYRTSEHQNKQLTFFLNLFKFQEAKRKLEFKAINLKEIIDWNVSMVRHHAKAKNVAIRIEVPENILLECDEIMIGQVVQNLASNGLKYNRQDGILTIRASQKDDRIKIEFIDTGIGIPKRDIDKIFKKFTRIKSIESNKTLGYGLGLTFVRECIDLHHGKIIVKSEQWKGSIFTITLKTQQKTKTNPRNT